MNIFLKVGDTFSRMSYIRAEVLRDSVLDPDFYALYIEDLKEGYILSQLPCAYADQRQEQLYLQLTRDKNNSTKSGERPVIRIRQ